MSQKYETTEKTQQAGPSPIIWVIVVGAAMVLAAIVLSIGGGLGAAASGTTTGGGPHLVVDKTEENFGDVKLGQQITASFTISNTGGEPLRFTEAPYVELIEGC